MGSGPGCQFPAEVVFPPAAAPAPAAFAQNGAAVAQPVLTKQMVKPYNEAITAIQAKDYATAQTKITEAAAQAKTPVDKGQIERLKLQVAIDTKNAAQQVASVNILLGSGTLSPDETKQYKGALPGMYTAAGDETNSLIALRAYVDEYNATPDNLISIADKASKQNDFATAATYAEKAIAASTSATGAPETWYRLYMRSLEGHATPKAYLDAQFTYDRDTGRSRVLASSVVGRRTYYAAVEWISAGTEAREVWGLVCLVRHNPRDREGLVFGYKDMSESMGPCESDCPARILDLLRKHDVQATFFIPGAPSASDMPFREWKARNSASTQLADASRRNLRNNKGSPRRAFVVESGGPRQRHPGARLHRYRCSLPGLAGFTACRRGGTSADRRGLSPLTASSSSIISAWDFPVRRHTRVEGSTSAVRGPVAGSAVRRRPSHLLKKKPEPHDPASPLLQGLRYPWPRAR